MRKKVWLNGDKMRIDTGHRGFNKQCESLGVGNVWGTCQFSNYIRSYTETECDGFTFPVGDLQKADLDHFKDIPSHIRQQVEQMTRNTGGILYEIRHWGRRLPYQDRRQKIIHGYILTAQHNSVIPYRHLRTFQLRHGVKSYSIMATAREYVSEQ